MRPLHFSLVANGFPLLLADPWDGEQFLNPFKPVPPLSEFNDALCQGGTNAGQRSRFCGSGSVQMDQQ